MGHWHIKTYDALIEKYRNYPKIQGETEQHHIVPRSLGGGNEKTNLVNLPIRCHYIAHKLLVRIHWNSPENKQKMCAALWLMSRFSKYSSSHHYENARRGISEYVLSKFADGTHHLLTLAKSENHPSKVRARKGLPCYLSMLPTQVLSEAGKKGGTKSSSEGLARGTHVTLDPVFQENNNRIRQQLLSEGKHVFQRPGFQSEVNNKRVQQGTHNLQGPETNIRSWQNPETRAARCKNISINKRINSAKRRISENRARPGDAQLIIDLTLEKEQVCK